MLDILKFIQGSVAKKDFVPALTHFRIDDGKIQGYNGAISLCSPIDLDVSCSPKAVPFIKAIQACADQETVQFHLTKTGRLSIRSGNFQAFIECLPEQEKFPEVIPEGQDIQVDGAKLVSCVRQLSPLTAEDASRPWARGVLFRGQSAYATNNIIIAEKWLGSAFPEINIPIESIVELLRIDEPPSRIQAADGSITFFFSGGKWLRSQLLPREWPDVNPILDQTLGTLEEIPDGLFSGLDVLAPFVNDLERVYLTPGYLRTEIAEDTGASIAVEGLGPCGCYNIFQFQMLAKLASSASISSATVEIPKFAFQGDELRGVFVGMRV